MKIVRKNGTEGIEEYPDDLAQKLVDAGFYLKVPEPEPSVWWKVYDEAKQYVMKDRRTPAQKEADRVQQMIEHNRDTRYLEKINSLGKPQVMGGWDAFWRIWDGF